MRHFHVLCLICSWLLPTVLPAQPDWVLDTLAHRASKGDRLALDDIVSWPTNKQKRDSLLAKLVVGSPFIHPHASHPSIRTLQEPLIYRPECQAFLWLPTDTVLTLPAAAPVVSASQPRTEAILDPEIPSSMWWQLVNLMAFAAPADCQTLHRLLTYQPPTSEALYLAILQILTRWDPGEHTLRQLLEARESGALTEQQVTPLISQIYYGKTDHLAGPKPQQIRQQTYADRFGRPPFLYDHPVDFYGACLTIADAEGADLAPLIYDLLTTRHPRVMYYLLALSRHSSHASLYTTCLKKILHRQYDPEQCDAWIGHILLQSHHWSWSDQDHRFHYLPGQMDQSVQIESWFRELASSDQEAAEQAFHEISLADPDLVGNLSPQFRSVFPHWHAALPPPSAPYPEVASQLAGRSRHDQLPIMLHHRLLDLAHLLRTDLPLAGRISLEDTLIHYSTEDDITAWEHLGLRWSSFPAANRSISRITDKLYQSQPLTEPQALLPYLRRCGLFRQLPGPCGARRYPERLSSHLPRRLLRSWQIRRSDPDLDRAISQILDRPTLDSFLRQPAALTTTDILNLPPPDPRFLAMWQDLPIAHWQAADWENVMSYVIMYPEPEVLTLLLTAVASPSTGQLSKRAHVDLITALEYSTNLYGLALPLDWWLARWRSSDGSWGSFVQHIDILFRDSLAKQTVSHPALLFGFVCRQSDSLDAELYHYLSDPRIADQRIDLPLPPLRPDWDWEPLIGLGIPPARLASLSVRPDTSYQLTWPPVLNKLLLAAQKDGALAETGLALWQNGWVKDMWASDQLHGTWGALLDSALQAKLVESRWISAYEEAQIMAYRAYLRAPEHTDRQLALILQQTSDPTMRREACRWFDLHLTWADLPQLLDTLQMMPAHEADLIGNQILAGFALPPLDWSCTDDILLLRQALASNDPAPLYDAMLSLLSPSFRPPQDDEIGPWFSRLLQEEYIRPLFGTHAKERIFPLLTAAGYILATTTSLDELDHLLLQARLQQDPTWLIDQALEKLPVEVLPGVNAYVDGRYN